MPVLFAFICLRYSLPLRKLCADRWATRQFLSAWLTDVMHASESELPGADTPPDAMAAQASLLVLRSVLQAVRVPVFVPGQVLQVQRVPAGAGPATAQGMTVHVHARVPRVDHVHSEVYRGALAFTALWMPRLMQEPPSQSALAQWIAALEQEIVRPLQPLVPGGQSSFQLMRAAHAMNIPFMHLGGGVYQLGWGRAMQRLDRSSGRADSAMGARLAQDKALTAQVLGASGLPVPQHVLVRTPEQAQAAAVQLGWPVVVKPADRERGEGVQLDVRHPDALARAFDVARQFSKTGRLLVEQQVPGICHRLLVAHGQLLYAVKRWPRSVWGDGQRSVQALLEALQAPQARWPLWQREPDVPIDDALHAALAQQGLTLQSVAPPGQRVLVRPLESTQWGGSDEDVTKRVHPDNRELALRATRLLGLSVAGVDLMCHDISQPWHRSGAVLNEVNHAPLLGGAPISRGYLPAYLRGLMGGSDGRIPVEVFEGVALADLVAQRMQALARQGLHVWVTTATQTWQARPDQPSPAPVPLQVRGLSDRTRALLMEPLLDHLLLWVTDPAELHSGLPVDRITRWHRAPGAATPTTPPPPH